MSLVEEFSTTGTQFVSFTFCVLGSNRISHTVSLPPGRSHVIYALPKLKCMDFSAVTPQERVMARYRHQGLQARRPTEDPDDF